MCNCILCGYTANKNEDYPYSHYNCSVCGKYTIDNQYFTDIFLNYFNTNEQKEKRSEFITRYSSYIFYHSKFLKKNQQFLIGDSNSKIILGNIYTNIDFIEITDKDITDFFPTKIQQYKKLILSKIYSDRDLSNNIATYTEPEAESLFFIYKNYINNNLISSTADSMKIVNELLENLIKLDYIECNERFTPDVDKLSIKITIKGREFVEQFENQDTPIDNSISVDSSTMDDSVVGNNNYYKKINNYYLTHELSNPEKHDIDALHRILADIPKKFNEIIYHRLVENRQYKTSEFFYIANLNSKINDLDNAINNNEIKILIDKLDKSFLDLYSLMINYYIPDSKNIDLNILQKPLTNQNNKLDEYYNILNNLLPKAIDTASEAYKNVYLKKIELFGDL